MTTLTAPNVAGAIESVESHLHPTPSWELTDHPAPSGREEIWRFTPIRRIASLLEDTPTQAQLEWDTHLPEGVSLTSIDTQEARRLAVEAPVDRISALAHRLSNGATLLDVAAEAAPDEPAVVTVSGTGQSVHHHLVIRIGRFASASVVVRHQGSATFAEKTDVIVEEGASVNLVFVQDWADDAVHGGQRSILVGRDASVKVVSASLGGNVVRLQENAKYAGPGGRFEAFGLYFVDAGQHVQHRLFVDHNAPHTASNVDYRGALQGEKAHSVWIGDVLIRKVAEGIETYEANKNLVLTDGCQADSVPNLEIETGEIQGAGHSSTTGRFDDLQLFYLRSRGVSEKEAKRLVVHGFFNDIIRRIGVPAVEARLLEALEAELAVLTDELGEPA
ncbi:MAG: Fe-S cluster assembly protein SufD [Arachnia sp.]